MAAIKILLVAVIVQCTIAEVYIADISATTTDSPDGTLNNPFPSITLCVKALKNPGDECQIRKGRYREIVTVKGLRGTKEKPFVIRGYMDERPTLDGTVEIEPINGPWQIRQIEDETMCFGKMNSPIWQLFFDDLMMTNARWPDAKWSDKSVFDSRVG